MDKLLLKNFVLPKAKPCTPDNKPFRLCGETVCDALVCAECLKPRCIYGIRRLTPAEFQLLGRVKEDVLYVCGSTLFDFTSELAKICCVELNVNCNSDMSSHYYSCKKKFQVCCYVCGCRPVSAIKKRVRPGSGCGFVKSGVTN